MTNPNNLILPSILNTPPLNPNPNPNSQPSQNREDRLDVDLITKICAEQCQIAIRQILNPKFRYSYSRPGN